MIKIPYIPQDFGPSRNPNLFSAGTISTEWPAILRCAIMVGKPSTFFQPWPGWFDFEVQYRTYMLLANLDKDPATGQLVQSEAFHFLDPSEKGAISYFFGLTFAKLFSEHFFGITELVHLGVFGLALNPVYRPKTRMRPDLVGLDQRGDLVVVEAKGSSNRMSEDTLDKGKRQVRTLRSISGHNPSLRMVSGVHFPSDTLEVILRDPDEPNEESIDIELSTDELRRQYYQPLNNILLLSERPQIVIARNQVFNCHRFSVPDIIIGLRQDISVGTKEHFLSAPEFDYSNLDNNKLNVGIDGVICIVGELPKRG